MTDLPHGLPDPALEPAFYEGVTLKRGGAWVVDVAATLALCVAALPFTAFTGILWWPLLWLLVGFAYRWASLAAFSATLGMLLMAVTIRGPDGRRLDAAQAFAHTLGYTASVIVLPVQLLSVALMAALGRGQGLTDLVIGTRAINRPLPTALGARGTAR